MEGAAIGMKNVELEKIFPVEKHRLRWETIRAILWIEKVIWVSYRTMEISDWNKSGGRNLLIELKHLINLFSIDSLLNNIFIESNFYSLCPLSTKEN